MGQVIAIVSQKGGVGKTSTAVNLGACISALKKKVLLVELDSQCGLAKCLGLDGPEIEAGILEAITDGSSRSDLIIPAHPRLPRLDVIPANIRSLADETNYMSLLQRDFGVLKRLLSRTEGQLRLRVH